MILGLCVLLLCMGLLLRRWRRRRSGTLAIGAAVVFLVLTGCGPLSRWMLHDLQDAYVTREPVTWSERNAIVLLAAGSERLPDEQIEPTLFAYGRIATALAMYRDCHASGHDCKLLVTGGDPQRHGTAEAVVYGRLLERMGVPVSDQIVESRSNSTWQNAQFSRPLLESYRPGRIWLVTSGIHMRRSLLYFDHFGIRPQPVRGDYVHASWGVWPSTWNVALADAALHEYLGIARYRVYNMLGMNAPRSPALATEK
ncbi:MAG TPA: YdcF family protein [Dyella sp.]|uniref:YdcF family protein n=1 Tax=Dyella sp. TaxID=1869338 RepID=UPI002F957C5D